MGDEEMMRAMKDACTGIGLGDAAITGAALERACPDMDSALAALGLLAHVTARTLHPGGCGEGETAAWGATAAEGPGGEALPIGNGTPLWMAMSLITTAANGDAGTASALLAACRSREAGQEGYLTSAFEFMCAVFRMALVDGVSPEGGLVVRGMLQVPVLPRLPAAPAG